MWPFRDVPKQVGGNSHTHDWEVYLRGVCDKNGKRDKIENFIDKVRYFFVVRLTYRYNL
jgi:hypothetical protein